MGLKDGKLLYCHGVAEVKVDRKISKRYYNNMMVYDCFDNLFTYKFGSPALNLPPITFDDIPRPHKRARYTPDLLSAASSVASENSFSNLTTPSDFPDLFPSYDTNTLHVMNMDVTLIGRLKRGYYCRNFNTRDSTKIQGSIAPHALIRTRKFIIVVGFP